MKWHRNNQSLIIGKPQDNFNGNDDEEQIINNNEEGLDPERITNNNSSKSFLAESFTGGPRHLKSCGNDALTIVSELGGPTAFITFTCNPNWDEIQSKLLIGQTAFDRPDLVDIVFHAKLNALVHNLRNGKYFGNKKTVYILYVIEYQNRGLPHAHIVCRVEDIDDDEESKLEWIRKYIQARYPDGYHDVQIRDNFSEYMINIIVS